jgi:MFS family permease
MRITPGDLIAASAGSLPQLVTGQAVAGMGGAAIFPSSLAVLIAATPRSEGGQGLCLPGAVSVAFGAMLARLVSGGAP